MADDFVVGVVRSTNLAADGQSLTITPLTAIDDLPNDGKRQEFWAALGVADPDNLPLLSAEGQRLPSGHDRDYEYDVYISYWPEGTIEPWVRKRFIAPFQKDFARRARTRAFDYRS